MYTASDSIEFLKRIFGRVDVFGGGNVQVRCPQCSSRKRKLAINVEKNLVFHCWVCEYKGSFFKLLKHYYPEHLREFIERFCDEKVIKNSKEKKDPPITLPNDFRLLATRQDSKNPEIKRAIRYLYNRGLTSDDLWYWKFGISNFKCFDNRVILPSFSINGGLNYYAARALMSNMYPKYLLPRQAKKEIIFNEINIDWQKELILVEGQFDLVKCGGSNATCLSGSSLSEDSFLFIKIIQNKTCVLLALDKDMEHTKTPQLVKCFLSYGIQTRVLPLNGFDDVGQMSKKDFRKLRTEAKVWNRVSVLKQRIEGLRG